MKDKYDEAVEYLTAHPGEIRDTWRYPFDSRAGCLFNYAAPGCGCLTQIARMSSDGVPHRDDLTEAIRADSRIPRRSIDITVESLPVFAEWQRRLDVELGRCP